MGIPTPGKGTTRRSLMRRGGSLAASLTLGGAGLLRASPAHAQTAGLHGVIVQGSDVISLDPRKERAMYNEVVVMAAAEKLLRMSKTKYGTLEGLLATNWSLVNDKTWRFSLRQRVKYHNGETFTAESLKAWMDLYRTQALSRDRLDAVDSISVVDDHTVDFNMKSPYALLPFQLNAVGSIVEPGWSSGAAYAENKLVGTGPYRLVEWVKGQRVRYEINPEYWGWNGKPEKHFATLDFRPIPEAATRAAALLTDAADIARDISIQDIIRFKDARNHASVVTSPSNRCVNVFLRDDIPPTNDVRVRQALNYAVDVDALIKVILGGYGVKLPGQSVGATVIGCNPDIVAYPYDPAKAKQLLRDAGYPNGFDIKFDTSSGLYEKDVETASAIAGMLAKVGIRAEIVINEAAQYNAKFVRSLPTANLFFWASGNIVPEAENAFNDLLVRPGQKDLTSGFHNKDLEAIQTQLKQTLDPEKRLSLAHAGMQIAHEQAPMIFLYQQVNIYGRSGRTLWAPRPDEWILTDEVLASA